MISQVAEFHDAFGVKRDYVDVELRYKLFKEEFEEYKDAKDLVERADAIVDMLYIACGTLDVHGWKMVKDNLYIGQLECNTLSLIKTYIETYRITKSKLSIINLIDEIITLAYINGIYDILPELFNEVHASNLSKLDENGKPIINDGILDTRKPIGKILKSELFFEPKLKQILERYERIK